MEHPGVDIAQIKEELTLEQVQGKINDLNNRMTFAYRTGNQSLINQLDMVLEVYTRAQREKLEEMFGNKDGPDLDGKIDIS